MQQIKNLVGTPILSPYPYSPLSFIYDVLDDGVPQLGATEIVVESALGAKVIFRGNFTIAGNDVTGGTMTGLDIYLGSTPVLTAKGFSLDAATLYDTIEGFGTDSDPFYDLIFAAATKFVGSKYDDIIFDGLSNDLLLGRDGNDVLMGSHLDDTLKGGKGNDFLADYEGTNTFFGGPGDDVFAFDLYSMSIETAVGKIKDFEKGEDRIGLMTDLGLQPGTLGEQYFHKGTGAGDGDDYIIYDRESGKLYVDFDGSGAGPQVQFAKVTPGTKLHADDIFVGFGLA
jgi:Ca2+-binding RTX toxin-like protein